MSFIDIVPDSLTAYIHFESKAAAAQALRVQGLGQLSLLRGEAERQYWLRLATSTSTAKQSSLKPNTAEAGAKGNAKSNASKRRGAGKPMRTGFEQRKGTVSF